MKPVELGFSAVLKRYLKDTPHLWSWWETGLAFLIAITVTTVVCNGNGELNVANSVAGKLFSASAQLLGVVVMGFSVFTMALDSRFSRFVSKVGALEGLLFPFWLNAAQWIVAMIINGILYVITQGIAAPLWLVQGTLFLAVLWFALTISFLVSLVGTLFKLAVYRSAFEEVASSQK